MQNKFYTQRLSNSNYNKPKHTIQEKLTEEEIDDKLIDYKEVDDISKVPIGTHIRYFTEVVTDGKTETKFRLGGMLTNKDCPDKFVVLSNGVQSWSVQVAKSTFYRKMSIDEIKEEYELEIMELKEEIKKLKKQVKKLQKDTT